MLSWILMKKFTWIFWIANTLGHISKAAIAANKRPVSPLTTTRLNKHAQATAVKWLPSLAAADSGPCEVARSNNKSKSGSVKKKGRKIKNIYYKTINLYIYINLYILPITSSGSDFRLSGSCPCNTSNKADNAFVHKAGSIVLLSLINVKTLRKPIPTI